jgi:imidazolonepropionase
MAAGKPGLGVIEDGVIGTIDGRIAFLGPGEELPGDAGAQEVIPLDGRWVTPGLIDCHSHIVYAGNRAAEWEMRLAGAAYEDIARAGGGILSSVRAVRAASEDELLAQTLPRVDRLIAEGVTTLESKSGYGLDLTEEMKLLRVGRHLPANRALRVFTSFLGAHALPPEADGDRDGYVDLICDTMLPAIAAAGLADAVDAFCESIAFSPPQVARVFKAAQALGLPVKLHADQLTNTDEDGAAAMAKAGTVAVLLPGAYYVLRERQAPPVGAFRKHGVPMAVSTDCNPGTSPLTSLLLTMHLAATLFGLTVEEALLGTTREAARALGRFDDIGSLEMGKACDLAIWSVERPAEIFHNVGFNPLHGRVFAGQPDQT